jgi:hypothetical protein
VKRTKLLVCVILCVWPLRSRALFGVGDIVYDPASVAQTINLVQQAQQAYDRLGSLLGVSTRQFDQLVQLNLALGNPAEAAAFAQAATPAELQALIQSIPGLEQAQLSTLFRPDGQLDVFLGLSVANWAAAVENPERFYQQAATATAATRSGASLTTPLSAATYAQWWTAESAEDQRNLAPHAAADLAAVMGAEWLQSSRTRKTNLQSLAAGNQTDAQSAGQAQTLADQGKAQAKLSVRTNQILLEQAAQSTAAQEATLRSVSAQQTVAESAQEERRNAAALLLDGQD